jgi:hypothetical protein
MKLPLIKSSNITSHKLITNKYKITEDNSKAKDNKQKLISTRLNEVQEIKIYLSQNFNAYDVDQNFIKDMEIEYAEQYLNKLEILPTKYLVNKLLSLRPLEKCDFYLTTESILTNEGEKTTKIVHIYPSNNNKNSVKKKNLNQSEGDKSNSGRNYLKKNIESIIKLKPKNENKVLKERIALIKKNNKIENENLIYHKENIDEIFSSNYDDMEELKLFSQKNPVKVDLSFENIKKKYVITKKIGELREDNDKINFKAKFYNISNSISSQKNVLENPKYKVDMTELDNLNEDIIKEITTPIDIKLEAIMTDINYIIDNFPMDNFINIDEDFLLKNKSIKTNESTRRSKSQGGNKLYKINLDKQEDLLKIYKVFHSMDFYRLVCLTLNLIYWVIFGNQNDIQIDINTKEYLYLKLLNQIDLINSKLVDIKLLSKIFIPLEIIIIRIEVDNYLSRKFVHLFDEYTKKNKENIMIKVNNLITEIFDKHGYMNTFETICGTRNDFNNKFMKNLMPRFRKRIFDTSNMLEQLFNKDKIVIEKDNMENIKERQEFILGPKVDFFNSYLNRINYKLKKRNLAPIFTISNNNTAIKNERMKTEEIFDKKNKEEFNLALKTSNSKDNERYENLESYMDQSIKKFQGVFRTSKLKYKDLVGETEIKE